MDLLLSNISYQRLVESCDTAETPEVIAETRTTCAGSAYQPPYGAGHWGACLHLDLGHVSAAVSFLLGFDKPGELYQLKKRDFTWAGGKAVVSLRNTKTGQRKGAQEMVVCENSVTNFWLTHALQGKSPDDLLLDVTPKELRCLFFAILAHLEIQGYSLRRGGATGNFVMFQSMEHTHKHTHTHFFVVAGLPPVQQEYISKMPQLL